ncbi:hypothetical protein A0H81_00078 [Grifola frondosa]|uniref:Uncharacterized protein n=1 Tax=Grifola frondosa TaxID=5627 RepID=A0A1C7MRG4_GRIFR|nr:hypothetical protein A0H81_00078 [Grifola frondosa]
MRRALAATKAKLAASPEVEIVDFAPLKHGEGYDIIRELYFEDGGKAIRAQLAAGGEDALVLTEWVIAPRTRRTTTLRRSGRWVRAHIRHARLDRSSFFSFFPAAACAAQRVPPGVLGPLARGGLRRRALAPFPGPANPHDTAKYWGYTAIWNLLDYPGIVFPSGVTVDPAVDVADAAAQPAGPADAYNQSICDGWRPINLQLTARRFDDTMLVAAQEVVERILKA